MLRVGGLDPGHGAYGYAETKWHDTEWGELATLIGGDARFPGIGDGQAV